VGTITIPLGEREVAIRSFCLDSKDNLLAACGGERVAYTETDDGRFDVQIVNEPAAIRVISPAGKLVATWDISATPQAVNVGPDGCVYCGGSGKLIKLGPNGEVLREADAPHACRIPQPDEDRMKRLAEMDPKAKAARIAELGRQVATAREK